MNKEDLKGLKLNELVSLDVAFSHGFFEEKVFKRGKGENSETLKIKIDWEGLDPENETERQKMEMLKDKYQSEVSQAFNERRASIGCLEIDGFLIQPCVKCENVSSMFGKFPDTLEELEKIKKGVGFLVGKHYIYCENLNCRNWKWGNTKQEAVQKWNDL